MTLDPFVEGISSFGGNVAGKGTCRTSATSQISASYTPGEALKPNQARKIWEERVAKDGSIIQPNPDFGKQKAEKVVDKYIRGANSGNGAAASNQAVWTKDRSADKFQPKLGFAIINKAIEGVFSTVPGPEKFSLNQAPKFEIAHVVEIEKFAPVQSGKIVNPPEVCTKSVSGMSTTVAPISKPEKAEMGSGVFVRAEIQTTVAPIVANIDFIPSPEQIKRTVAPHVSMSFMVNRDESTTKVTNGVSTTVASVNRAEKTEMGQGTSKMMSARAAQYAALVTPGSKPDPRAVAPNGVTVNKDVHIGGGKISSTQNGIQKLSALFHSTKADHDIAHTPRPVSKPQAQLPWTQWKATHSVDFKTLWQTPFNQLTMAAGASSPMGSYLAPFRNATENAFARLQMNAAVVEDLHEATTGVGLSKPSQIVKADKKAQAMDKASEEGVESVNHSEENEETAFASMEFEQPKMEDKGQSLSLFQAMQLQFSEKTFTTSAKQTSSDVAVAAASLSNFQTQQLINFLAGFGMQNAQRVSYNPLQRLSVDRVQQVRDIPMDARVRFSVAQTNDVIGKNLTNNLWLSPDVQHAAAQARRGWPHWMIVPLETWDQHRRPKNFGGAKDPAQPSIETQVQRLLELMPDPII